MSFPGARIGRFVKAARTLLLAQLVAAVIAVALGVWAVVAVRDLAAERDRLREQLTAVQAQGPAASAPVLTPAGPPSSPLDTEVRPPAILPMAIPVFETPPETNILTPETAAPDPAPTTGEAAGTGAGEQDCTGANATAARCRSGRWNRRDPVLRPIPSVQPEPQQEQPKDQPTPRTN